MFLFFTESHPLLFLQLLVCSELCEKQRKKSCSCSAAEPQEQAVWKEKGQKWKERKKKKKYIRVQTVITCGGICISNLLKHWMSPLFFSSRPGMHYSMCLNVSFDSGEKFVLMKTKFSQRRFDLICMPVICDKNFQIFKTFVVHAQQNSLKQLFFLNQAAVDTAHCYGPCQMKQHIWTGRAMPIKCPPMPVYSLMGPAEAATGSHNMSQQKRKLLALFQTENKS